MKFFLILFLVFSFSANPTDAYAYFVLGEIKVLRELTKEDIEAEIRKRKITEDPKKVIKLKFGVPEAAKKNNSVINLYTPFHIVIDPPLAGDLEVFYNSSQSEIQTETL